MEIRATVDATKAIEGLHELQADSMPYALARSLTKTALDGQAAVRESLPAKFTLRNRFFEGGIRIKPADKKSPTRIEADVHTYTENKTTGAPGFAERQQDGGEKVPVNGRAHLAVPTRYLRQMAPGAIPAELRPRALLGFVANQGKFRSRKGSMSGMRMVRGFVFFLQTLKDGTLSIMGRHMHDEDAYPFYILIPAAHIKPRFNMAETVQRVATARFPANWAATWKDILGKGMRVRF